MTRIHCELGGSFTLSAAAERLYRTSTLESLMKADAAMREHAINAARAICERDCASVEASLGVTRYRLECGRVVAFYGHGARIEKSAKS